MATQLKNSRTQEDIYPVLEEASVDTSNIKDNAVKTAKIEDGAITSDKLASNSVTTDKIANFSVTNGKLADNSVNAQKIQNGTITAEKMGTGVIPRLNKYYATLQLTEDDTTKVTIFFLTKYTLSSGLTFDDIKAYLSEGDYGHVGEYRNAGELCAYVCANGGLTPQITYNNGSNEANFTILVDYGFVKSLI